MSDNFIVFGQPLIEENDIEEVVKTLKSGWIGTGPKVKQFETDFAFKKKSDAANVTAVNSCTAALHLSLITAGIGPGDEVITTAMTFCATINAIIHAGGTPVLVDIDPATYNIDPAQIEDKITAKTKAIIPVHFAGLMCDMNTITSIAKKHGLIVIEDCAHAIESESPAGKAGMIGDFGCFSFYVTKNVCTGEGGMIISRLKSNADRIRTLALHGMSKDAWHRFGDEGYKQYQVVECGFKYNMMDIQAALGIHQLQSLEKNWRRRKTIWEQYQSAFKSLPLTLPTEAPEGYRHAHHLYTLLIDETKTGFDRDSFVNQMTKKQIGVGIHYLSIPEHPYYQEHFGWKPEDYPVAMKIGRQTVSIPFGPALTDSNVLRVINAVQSSFENR